LRVYYGMLHLTSQERKVIIFLASMVLLGLGVSFCLKVNSRLEKFIQVDNAITRININTAGLEDMLAAPGVTLKLANSILAYRNSKGEFRDIEEIKQIKGVGGNRYEKLKCLFFVD
jgi:competence ComEA-like helix-hairpin-helix protein